MVDVIESVIQSQRRKGRKRKRLERETEGGDEEEEEPEEEREVEEEVEQPAAREEDVMARARTEGGRGWLTQEEMHCFRRYAVQTQLFFGGEEINTFIQKGCIKLIKRDFYVVKRFQINSSFELSIHQRIKKKCITV